MERQRNSSSIPVITAKNLKQLSIVFGVSMLLRMLLIPAYLSTDFDVHQNWLRITGHLPMKDWYFDNLSKWTLDYPPFFAYFECLLSYISQYINPQISQTLNSNQITINFQRLTVIISDIPYLLSLFLIFRQVNFKLLISYLFIPFIILDNIHFQYNIIMQGIIVVAVYCMEKRKFLVGAFIYGSLINFKHIYLYGMFAFFVYILKEYVLKANSSIEKVRNLVKVGVVTLIPFLLSFVPFLVVGQFQQLKQIFSRLFPFQRGLIHDYWAPNFWALYYFFDKIFYLISTKLLKLQSIVVHSPTQQLHKLRFLPQITPLMTTIIILFLTLPILMLYFKKSFKFHRLLLICGLIFFMFGFHVHEKAIAPYICLFFIFGQQEQDNKKNYINCAIFVNIVSLLPLMIQQQEKLLRIALILIWVIIWNHKYKIKDLIEKIVLIGGLLIIIYHEVIHPFISNEKMQFLPLMINSVFCAIFNFCWLILFYVRSIIFAFVKDQEQYRAISQLQE